MRRTSLNIHRDTNDTDRTDSNSDMKGPIHTKEKSSDMDTVLRLELALSSLCRIN